MNKIVTLPFIIKKKRVVCLSHIVLQIKEMRDENEFNKIKRKKM